MKESTIIRMGAEFIRNLDDICMTYKERVGRRLTREEALKRLLDRDPYLIHISNDETLLYFNISK